MNYMKYKIIWVSDYGTENEYGTDTDPDVSYPGAPAPEDTGSPEAARYDGYSSDPCAGIVCPEIDCPTRPYIPSGQCCPICPGQSQVLFPIQNKPNMYRYLI